jgi:hypothetical protein
MSLERASIARLNVKPAIGALIALAWIALTVGTLLRRVRRMDITE